MMHKKCHECFASCVLSQCALSALNDVRQYLTVGGGQVAVSRATLHIYYYYHYYTISLTNQTLAEERQV